MYDTLNLRLRTDEAGGTDFVEETACYLENVGEHLFNGDLVVTGNKGSLKISLNRRQLKIKDGSICKWYLGDNFQTLGRQDTKQALEKLSDELHLPIERASVTRLDLAQNIIMKHPVETYINHLGAMKYANRLQEPHGLYYSFTDGRLCFYDKTREAKVSGANIPELYQGKNVLRFEQRYMARIAAKLNVPEVTGKLITDEDFYRNLLKRWKSAYSSIQKINDVVLNFEAMKTKQDLNKMGVLSLIERAGGVVEMLEQINEAAKRGDLSRKQAFDLRKAVNEAAELKDGLTVKSDAITELDKKIKEAVMFYR